MKRVFLLLLLVILTFSCSQLYEGPPSYELPLDTRWDITPPPGVYPYNTPLSISIKSTAVDSIIKYTIDGFSFPGLSSGTEYNGDITINRPTLLRVVAITGDKISPLFEAKYDYKLPLPTFDKSGMIVNVATPVTISCPEINSQIRYTTDGSDPSTRILDWITCFEGLSPQIPTINSTQTIRAIALHWEFQTSDVRTETYTYMPGKFVSKTGNDANDGSPQTPYLTIQRALNDGIGTYIYVSAGQYNETLNFTTNGQILLGGYRQGNWLDRNFKDRDNPAYKTEIVSSTGYGLLSSGRAGIVAQGFVIIGKGYGIRIDSSSTINVSFNTITGRDSPTTGGLEILSSDGSVEYNIIAGGNGTATSYGIYINGGGTIKINQNLITAGFNNPVNSYGIYSIGAATPQIYNCIIHGGNGATTHGLRLENANIQVINNTVISGAGTGTTTALYTTASGAATPVVNNIFLSESTGTNNSFILTTPPLTIENNSIQNGMNDNDFPFSPNNTRISIVLDSYRRPTAMSHDDIKTGGTDASVYPGFIPVDIQDNPRTVPWSRGAYEFQ